MPVEMFTAEFWCPCGSLLSCRVNNAIVMSDAGYELGCRHCQQRYRIDPDVGAVPVENLTQERCVYCSNTYWVVPNSLFMTRHAESCQEYQKRRVE